MNFRGSVFLLRGLPGSGKSTLARELSESGKYPVYSVDDYFTDPISGIYTFDYSKNHLAYSQCLRRTEVSMVEGVSKIFIDNTLTLDWEVAPFFELSAKYVYKTFVMTVEKHHDGKNTHDISDSQIKKMAEKYKVKLF